MAVPKYDEFFPAFLQCLSDGETKHLKEIRLYCADALNVSEDDRQDTLENGKSRLVDRIGWTRTYLKKAGLIESPTRAHFRLTNEGKKAVEKGSEKVNIDYLRQYQSFRVFIGEEKADDEIKPGAARNSKTELQESPQEAIDNAIESINKVLAEDLMSELLKMDPFDFEVLVVQLLEKMGYGKRSIEATKKSGDEGIDGILTSDRFGFDIIYTQAKRFKEDVTIGRPEIQKFLGALAGQGASKGIFITTSKFSNEAKKFAKKQLQQKIVLVDGQLLTQLMIEHDLGVSTVAEYKLKRIDLDFFNEGM